MIEEVIWSTSAGFDQDRLLLWLEQYAPTKIENTAKYILDSVNKLTIHPRLGRRLNTFQNSEVRELLISPYVIRYAIIERKIHIIRLWHYREDRFAE